MEAEELTQDEERALIEATLMPLDAEPLPGMPEEEADQFPWTEDTEDGE